MQGSEPPAQGDRLNVFLLNQSESMAVELGEFGTSMADAVASATNLYLQKLHEVRTLMPVGFTGEDFAVAVIGYGEEGARLVLYIDPSGTKADEKLTRSDEAGASSERTKKNFPFWIRPTAQGEAPLCEALRMVQGMLSSWVSKHQSAEPPNVINVTNGSISDGDPRKVARKIRDLTTVKGNATLWLCHLASSRSEPILFPTEDVWSKFPRPWRILVDTSSIVPSKSIHDMLLEFPEVSKVTGARCCVFNADLAVLVRAIACITRLPLP